MTTKYERWTHERFMTKKEAMKTLRQLNQASKKRGVTYKGKVVGRPGNYILFYRELVSKRKKQSTGR